VRRGSPREIFDVPALQFVQGPHARRVRAHDVIFLDVRFGTLSAWPWARAAIVIGLARVGALAPFSISIIPCYTERESSATAPLESRVEYAPSDVQLVGSKIVHLMPEPRNVVRSHFRSSPSIWASLRDRL